MRLLLCLALAAEARGLVFVDSTAGLTGACNSNTISASGQVFYAAASTAVSFRMTPPADADTLITQVVLCTARQWRRWAADV